MGPATGSLAPIPLQLPFQPIAGAVTPTAQTPTKAIAAAATATAVQNQQVAEFTTAAGTEAHAAAIVAGATEEEAAQAAQAAPRAALIAAQAAIAGPDAIPTHPPPETMRASTSTSRPRSVFFFQALDS